MAVGRDVFTVARVNRVMRAIQDERELPQELAFLNRTAIVPAIDSEIMARFTGRVQIADIVSDDAEALIYSSGKFTFESTPIPNLKHGVGMPQSQINELQALSAVPMNDPDGIFRNWENRTVDGLLLGIRQRMEALIVGMMIDGYSYDRLGIKMSNVSWGMPADLKITVSPAWTDAANAEPVNDILELNRLARVRYGTKFDRMTLSLTAFNYLIATTQFQTYLKNLGVFGPVPAGALVPVANTDLMRQLAAPILGLKEIEIYDARYWSQAPNGTITSASYLPINKVVFTSTMQDNDPNAYDFANGIVTESIVSSLVPNNVIGQFAGPTRGPVSYVAAANPQLNPPGIVYFGVARGFPRKHSLQSSAVFTVGSFTDDIPVGEPF